VLREQQQKRLGSQVQLASRPRIRARTRKATLSSTTTSCSMPSPPRSCNGKMVSWLEVWVPEQPPSASTRSIALQCTLRHTGFSGTASAASCIPAFTRLAANWTPHWNSGAMLTIDYGDDFPQLYHRRPHGTLRAYLCIKGSPDPTSMPTQAARTSPPTSTSPIIVAWLHRRSALRRFRVKLLAEFLQCAEGRFCPADRPRRSWQRL
jgi:hypothetical protein